MHSPQKAIRKLTSNYFLAAYFSDSKGIQMLNYFLRKGRAIIREDYAKLLEKLISKIG
jgi:hypothetical protein